MKKRKSTYQCQSSSLDLLIVCSRDLFFLLFSFSHLLSSNVIRVIVWAISRFYVLLFDTVDGVVIPSFVHSML